MLKKFFTLILVLFLSLAVPGSIKQIERESVDFWKFKDISDFQPEKGDYFMADLGNGIGYLTNKNNKTFTLFPILSGQKWTPTPEQVWIAKEKNIQGDRVTFSSSGEFLRLYSGEKGEKFTHYGIHGHKYFKEMLETGGKFKSLGCILVADDVLDVIEGSFIANLNELKVITINKRGSLNLTSFLKASFSLNA